MTDNAVSPRTPETHPDEYKIPVLAPPHPTPYEYAHYQSKSCPLLLRPLDFTANYLGWYTGGLLQSWITRDQFGKCRQYSAMVRRDGKIFGTPYDEGIVKCTPWDHYATVVNARLHGISSDGYKFVNPP